MSTVYVFEQANLVAGVGPAASKHLTITELKLPVLQEMYQDHHAGGALAQIEVSVGVQKLEATFKLMGFDPALMAEFGLNSRQRMVYTAYQVVTDKRTGRKIEHRAIMEGRLGKVEQDANQRGNLMATDYAINEIMRYELWYDRSPIIEWDFAASVWRVNGVDQLAAENAILRIA